MKNLFFLLLLLFVSLVLICCEDENSNETLLLGYGVESDGKYQIMFFYKSIYPVLRKEYYSIGTSISDAPICVDSAVYTHGLIKKLYRFEGSALMEMHEFKYNSNRIVERTIYNCYDDEERPLLARRELYTYDNIGQLNHLTYIMFASPGGITEVRDTLFKDFFYDDSHNLIKSVTIDFLGSASDSTQALFSIEKFSDYDNMKNPFYGSPFQDLFYPCNHTDGPSIYSGYYYPNLQRNSTFVYSSLSKSNFRSYDFTSYNLDGSVRKHTEINRSIEYNSNGYPLIGKYSN